MITLRKVLVATDFSAPSEAALAYGRELARNFGATLSVVHIVDDIIARAYGIDGGVIVTDPDVQRQYEATAREQVEALLTANDRIDLKASATILVSNTPAAAIVSYAREASVDLIVMGTHGRGGVAHLLMGSVSERVVRTAPCPVLTVRHPEHEFVLPDALVAVART